MTEVKQFYTQNGRTIEHPKYSLNGNQHNSISDKMCADWVHETKDDTNSFAKDGLQAVGDAFTAGVVLVVSLWDDHDANMLWLDSKTNQILEVTKVLLMPDIPFCRSPSLLTSITTRLAFWSRAW